MGDSCCADHSIGAVRALIERELPGVFVHSISTGSGTGVVADVLSSYFGNLNEQVRALQWLPCPRVCLRAALSLSPADAAMPSAEAPPLLRCGGRWRACATSCWRWSS